MKRKIFLFLAIVSVVGMIAISGCKRDDDEESENGGKHEYVDLGLPSGTLWATCNLGAETPEGYGNYYAWGETTTKQTYTLETYRYAEGTSWEDPKLTKYCNYADYGNNGFTDNLTTIETSDDAATANWGAGWRMPTQSEMQELYDNCTNEWTTRKGVNGRLFTGPNGKSLFLPATGRVLSSGLYGDGDGGCYWSSSLYTDTDAPYNAWCLYFELDRHGTSLGNRYCGYSVRPVCVQ